MRADFTAAEDLAFEINLMKDNSVVTRDGEYLGTWDTDETDAFYQFTPDGATEPLFSEPYIRYLCDLIIEWAGRKETGQV